MRSPLASVPFQRLRLVAVVVVRPGDVLRLDAASSVQFADDRAITFRVIRVDERPTYEGWVWLTGYELDCSGAAVERREVFVQVAGLRPARPSEARQVGRTR